MGFNQEVNFGVGMEFSVTLAICCTVQQLWETMEVEASNTCGYKLLTGCLQFTGNTTQYENWNLRTYVCHFCCK